METGTEEIVLEETPQTEGDTQEIPTPTKSEEQTRLEAELTVMQEKLNQKDESYKGLQRTLNKSNEDLRKRGDYDSKLEDFNAKFKILAAIISENKQSEVDLENITPQAKTDYMAKFNEIEKQQEQNRQMRDIKERVAGFQERTTQLGLTDKDPEYWEIEDAATNGKFQKAEAILAKIEKVRESSNESTKKEGDKVEDFEAKVSAEVEKRITEATKNNPLLKTDTAIPTGRAKSPEEVIEKFAQGDPSVSPKDYQDAARQLGY